MNAPYVPFIVAAAMLVLAGVLMAVVLAARRRHKRTHPDRAADARAAQGVYVSHRPHRAEEPPGDLERMARGIEARVDGKMADLQRLLAKADERIALLRDLVRSDSPGAEPPGASDAPARREEVLRLHAQGLDAVRIARRVEMDVGEVNLVLNLHKQRSEAPRQTPS